MKNNPLFALGITDEFYTYAVSKFAPQTDSARADHAVRGVLTETGELIDAFKRHIDYGRPLDTENVTEEIGDILFYLVMLVDTIPVTLDPPELDPACSVIDAITVMEKATNVCRTTLNCTPPQGRHYFYFVSKLEQILRIYLPENKATLQFCQKANIAKLNKRYPEGFSKEKSKERLDKVQKPSKEAFLHNLRQGLINEVITAEDVFLMFENGVPVSDMMFCVWATVKEGKIKDGKYLQLVVPEVESELQDLYYK